MCDELAWFGPWTHGSNMFRWAVPRTFRNAFRHGRGAVEIIHDSWFPKSLICMISWIIAAAALAISGVWEVLSCPETKWPSESLVLFPGFRGCWRQFAGNSQSFHGSDTVRVAFLRCQAQCEVRFPDLAGALLYLPSSILHKGSITAIAI